ncbi:tRNA CCA-pyrophosphorylase [Candidatus Bathyarchaeota archaeon]|nr:tRNA CCA-pyrophosphorylase [Candidatus Bathyarchaeota archaeon]
MRVLIITGRTINQGCHKERGKLSKEYAESVSICEMNEEDMQKLGIKDGDRIKITTKYGSIVLTARRSRKIQHPGIVFVPYGPWANYVIDSSTEGTGMPLLKGLPAYIEPTVEEVLSIKEMIDLIIS